MCLYPRIIRNKKYQGNKKNNNKPIKQKDDRTLFVPIGCGKCVECCKQKSRNWKVRLYEEVKQNNTGKFVTLTFNEPSLKTLSDLSDSKDPNDIATLAVRRFLERWRKKYKKSLRHWLITELGHKNTERIHLHGILFTNEIQDIKSIWQYGYTYIGQFVNERTINYIAKYVTKIDTDHPNFTGKILTSAGMGSNYTKKPNSRINRFKNEETNELYISEKGTKLPLPVYYRNKIYTEEEREQLWVNKLNKNTRFIMGEEINISTEEGMKKYFKALEYYREKNKRMGYGSIGWNKDKYKDSLKKLNNKFG